MWNSLLLTLLVQVLDGETVGLKVEVKKNVSLKTMLQEEIVIKFWICDEEVLNWQTFGYFMDLI